MKKSKAYALVSVLGLNPGIAFAADVTLTPGEYSNLMTYSESLRGSQAFYTIQPFVNVLQAAKARAETPASPPSGAPPAVSPAQPAPEPAKEPSGSKE